MTQNPNQFSQTPEVGFLDLKVQGTVISCQVSSSETVAITGGAALKIEDSAGGVIKVLRATADTDAIFGFAIKNLKDVDRDANDPLEVAIDGSVMYMTAGAAIARGAQVEADVSADKVITSAGTNTIVGWALDKAAADGDLIRVLITTPAVAP